MAGSAILVEPRFLFALVDYGLVMLAWSGAAVVAARPWRVSLLLGVGFSAAGGAVQQLGWGFGLQFNHNDLYHVIQAAALVAFYKADRRFSGATGDRHRSREE
jgi:hypothetical protein